MLPPTPRADTKSASEREYFAIIEQDLGDDWIVLHSLGLMVHATKPWAELDFVLIGPTGVFCIEFKGGGVERFNSVWYYTDRNGNTDSTEEGPFEQVGTGSSALFKFLSKKGVMNRVCLGYGVATPDIVFRVEGPDIVPRIVYDERTELSAFQRICADWLTIGMKTSRHEARS